MPKIDIETLRMIIQRYEPDARKVATIMEEIDVQVQAEEEERANRPPPVKKQFVMLLSDPEGKLDGMDDVIGWVAQIPEEDSPLTTADRIIAAAYNYNATPKGSRLPVQTIGEACEVVTAKLLKEQNVWIKTKIPVLAVPTRNKLPKETLDPA